MRARTATTLLLVCALLTACSTPSVHGGGGPLTSQVTTPTRGGTLDYLMAGAAIQVTDPQRVTDPLTTSVLQRTVYRSLVAFPPASGDAAVPAPVPDLATTTGTHDAASTSWSFTLRPGVTWQDGTPITCADLRAGFTRIELTGRPGDVADEVAEHLVRPGGALVAGLARRLDRAVTCSPDDRTVTYHFVRPWTDLPLVIAASTTFDPYRRPAGSGGPSGLDIVSDGPYELRGAFDEDRGGTLVRNPHWSHDDVRGAWPDVIRLEQGLRPGPIARRLTADRGAARDAVTSTPVPVGLARSVTGQVADRAVSVPSPSTDVLVPSLTGVSPPVRRALALATDRAAYVRALGGRRYADPARTVVGPSVPGYAPAPGGDDTGAPQVAAARAALRAAHVTTPVRVTLAFFDESRSDYRALASLLPAYRRAGLQVTLQAVNHGPPLFPAATMQRLDVEAAWPAPDATLPLLVDGRSGGEGAPVLRGYDAADTARLVRLRDEVAAAEAETDPAAADRDWAVVDASSRADGDDVPLVTPRLLLLRGGDVEGVGDPATNGYPDLASVALLRRGRDGGPRTGGFDAGRVHRLGSGVMSAQWTMPAWAAVAGLALLVVLLVVVVAALRALAEGRRRSAEALDAVRADTNELRRHLETLERRLARDEPVADPREYVITRLGDVDEAAEVEPAEPAPTLPAPLFADLVLREGAVQAASLAAGVRRAMSPEVRHRIRFAMRREIKAARKQRRLDARTDRRARRDAVADPA